MFRDIDIKFTRNIPADEQSIVNIVNGLKGTVSDETLLGQVPFVTDVKAELERVNEQKQSNLAMYSTNLFDDAQSESQSEEMDFEEK